MLSGLRDDVPVGLVVTVPSSRRVQGQPGLAIRYSEHLVGRRHPARLPPQTRVEHTVLDLVDQAPDESEVVSLVTAACQRRLTTTARLTAAGASRKKLRWRRLVEHLLADVDDGALSPLEIRYAREVERRHGLPRGERNRPERGGTRSQYRDVRYAGYGLVVELDGSAAHPGERRHRDMLRDNALVVGEDVATLRFGWHAVAGTPCLAAALVAPVLHRNGWSGPVRRCGPLCQAPDPARLS